VCMGRSQGKTRALEGQKKEGKDRGPRQEIIWGGGGKGEAGAAGEGMLAGRVRTCCSEPYLQFFAGYWVPAHSLIPGDSHLPLLRGCLAGNCAVLCHL